MDDPKSKKNPAKVQAQPQIEVEVAYVSPTERFVKVMNVALGTEAMQAIAQSGLLEQFPGLNVDKMGVYSRPVKPSYVLQAFDRVEIYRPLEVDPKEARRRRALGNKS